MVSSNFAVAVRFDQFQRFYWLIVFASVNFLKNRVESSAVLWHIYSLVVVTGSEPSHDVFICIALRILVRQAPGNQCPAKSAARSETDLKSNH